MFFENYQTGLVYCIISDVDSLFLGIAIYVVLCLRANSTQFHVEIFFLNIYLTFNILTLIDRISTTFSHWDLGLVGCM